MRIVFLLGSRQLTSLLLRWTNALGADSGRSDIANDGGGKSSVAGDEASAGVAAAEEKAALVAAGLKAVRIVCTKTDNNKGERCAHKVSCVLRTMFFFLFDSKQEQCCVELRKGSRSLKRGEGSGPASGSPHELVALLCFAAKCIQSFSS